MLLGSPPDMVHGAPSHRTRLFARFGTHINDNIIIYFFAFYNSFQKILYFVCKVVIIFVNVLGAMK